MGSGDQKISNRQRAREEGILLPSFEETVGTLARQQGGIVLGGGAECKEGKKPNRFVATEFIDPQTGCLNNLVDRRSKVSLGGWIAEGPDVGIGNVVQTIMSLGGTANSAENLFDAIRHPMDWATGGYETTLMTSDNPELYGIVNEDRDALGAYGTWGTVLATVIFLGMGASKNLDGSGRMNVMKSILVGGTTKVAIYLTGGSLAAQYRNYRGTYDYSPAEAYVRAGLPFVSWYDSISDPDDQFRRFIHGDMINTIILEGQISVWTGRAGHILGEAGFALLMPSGVSSMPGAGLAARFVPDLIQDRDVVQNLLRESTGLSPHINAVLADKADKLDTLTEELAAVDAQSRKKAEDLRAVRSAEGTSNLEKGRKMVKLESELSELMRRAEEVRKERAELSAFFATLERETGFPIAGFAEARQFSVDELRAKLDEVRQSLEEKNMEVGSVSSEKVRGRKAYKEKVKRVDALKREARALEHFRAELERVIPLREEGKVLQEMRRRAADLEGEVGELAQALRLRKTAKAERAAKVAELDAKVASLKSLKGEIAGNEFLFVRNGGDLRRLARRAARYGFRYGSFEGRRGSAALRALDEARSSIMLPNVEENALYARTSFWGKTGLGFVNSFRHGRIAATATRLVGLWATAYPEATLTYHYVWGKDWSNSMQSAASMFWTVPINQPWVNMLKNGHGIQKIPFIVEYLPSSAGVNLLWSVVKWDKDIMVQRCAGEVRALAESTDPKYQERIRDRVDRWWSMANEHEREVWDEQCGLRPRNRT